MATLPTPWLSPPPAPLTCEIVPDRDVVTVVALGELDIATVPQLDATLRDLRDAGFDHLRIDLRELSFIDVAGMLLLRRWRELARLDAFALDIDVKHGPVRRALELAELESVI